MDRRDRAALLLLDETLIAATLARARQAPRRRVCHNFHADAAADPQRFLNVMLRGTYVVPHRHRQVPKSESFLLLRGRCHREPYSGAQNENPAVNRRRTLTPDRHPILTRLWSRYGSARRRCAKPSA
jgi:cupin fold WbuC family metalloprotein